MMFWGGGGKHDIIIIWSIARKHSLVILRIGKAGVRHSIWVSQFKKDTCPVARIQENVTSVMQMMTVEKMFGRE